MTNTTNTLANVTPIAFNTIQADVEQHLAVLLSKHSIEDVVKDVIASGKAMDPEFAKATIAELEQAVQARKILDQGVSELHDSQEEIARTVAQLAATVSSRAFYYGHQFDKPLSGMIYVDTFGGIGNETLDTQAIFDSLQPLEMLYVFGYNQLENQYTRVAVGMISPDKAYMIPTTFAIETTNQVIREIEGQQHDNEQPTS